MLPEKHPTVAYAHTRFEEVNAAFVRVKLPQCQGVPGSLKYFCILDHQLLQESRGDHGPAPAWRNICETFSDHITSSAGLCLHLEEGYKDGEP